MSSSVRERYRCDGINDREMCLLFWRPTAREAHPVDVFYLHARPDRLQNSGGWTSSMVDGRQVHVMHSLYLSYKVTAGLGTRYSRTFFGPVPSGFEHGAREQT